ncbi:HAD-IIIA family hydrolase [Echinicola jeungdonensis]|uniref:KdsC family phosphatase n=1 Tax=Echinicola jeungdonensis TaxID=709343 RepID=A0ABV5J6G1_9BACT|nr:HAD-IIIA family hydrolase [Echinicola jeungdonensis]MDN3669791.1 HAD-IIIA family hydrolase [Echinicola jeungdonensis]
MENYLSGMNDIIREKASRVKLLITDIDGVLTDGGVIYDDNYLEYKKFNVKDGLIVKVLKNNGLKIGAITGRNSPVVRSRCEELDFDFHYHGISHKGEKLDEVLKKFQIGLDECAYIGDDLIDIPILTRVGFSAAPIDALPYVRQKVDFISSLPGGKGVFREVADVILSSKGLLEKIINELSEK